MTSGRWRRRMDREAHGWRESELHVVYVMVMMLLINSNLIIYYYYNALRKMCMCVMVDDYRY